MTLSTFLACFTSLLTGLVVVLLCWPIRRPITSNLFLKLFLALGVGFGISSLLFSLCLFVENSTWHLFYVEAFFLCSLVALYCMLVVRPKESEARAASNENHSKSTPYWKIRWVFFFGFLIALGSSLYASAALILREPHGGWDAFAIWNLRARFLFRAGAQWRDAFSGFLPWTHTDYPLMIPANVARLWKYSGHESVAVPALLGLIFTYAAVGLIVSAVATLRNRSQGFLAGLVLVSTPFFVEHGASQYADVPLSFFILATVVLVCMQDYFGKSPLSLLALAGLTAGFAGWTKNEGLLFLVSMIVAHAVVVLRRQGRTSYRRQLVPFTGGLMPILLTIVFFKLKYGGPSDIFSGMRGMVHQLLNPHRYLVVFAAFQRQVFDFGGWAIFLMPILAFYLFALGGEINPRDKTNLLIALLALIMTVVGYAMIYVMGPNDLQSWLDSSLNRLFLQVWPSAVFLFFLIVRTPEQAATVRARISPNAL
jgi:hypothetical protein